jgi:pimeloyl-ACP methyl ester carboxylesterase
MLPHLTDRFTCFLPSTRGKGLSAGSPDASPARLQEDVIAFIDSLGEPLPVMGWSGGGMFALGAAAGSDAVTAVAAYEPAVLEALTEHDTGRVTETVAQMAAETRVGRLVEAAQAFNAMVCTPAEQQAVLSSGRLTRAAPNMPTEVAMFTRLDAAEPSSTRPDSLRRIDVPVLLLQGEATGWRWFADGIRHVAHHVADCEIRTVPGAGHGGPGLAGQAVAEELIAWLTRVHQPA